MTASAITARPHESIALGFIIISPQCGFFFLTTANGTVAHGLTTTTKNTLQNIYQLQIIWVQKNKTLYHFFSSLKGREASPLISFVDSIFFQLCKSITKDIHTETYQFSYCLLGDKRQEICSASKNVLGFCALGRPWILHPCLECLGKSNKT